MFIEKQAAASGGESRHGGETLCGVVRWSATGTVSDVASEIRERGMQMLAFADPEFFADHAQAISMCREMQALGVNVLWSAHMTTAPSKELLCAMRMAGCQRLTFTVERELDVEATLHTAREYGFDVAIQGKGSTSQASHRTEYSVAEREEIACRLPELHAAQFDLAVAYYKARRFSEVMLPLGKAMTLQFPVNELCLNLLACLSAAKHYPDMAGGLLQLAGHGRLQPVVRRNQSLLKSWKEQGGDVKGVRLLLEPEHASPSSDL